MYICMYVVNGNGNGRWWEGGVKMKISVMLSIQSYDSNSIIVASCRQETWGWVCNEGLQCTPTPAAYDCINNR
jgi:hypothetical protein